MCKIQEILEKYQLENYQTKQGEFNPDLLTKTISKNQIVIVAESPNEHHKIIYGRMWTIYPRYPKAKIIIWVDSLTSQAIWYKIDRSQVKSYLIKLKMDDINYE